MEVINKNLGNACIWRACSTKLTRLFKGAPDNDLDDEIDGRRPKRAVIATTGLRVRSTRICSGVRRRLLVGRDDREGDRGGVDWVVVDGLVGGADLVAGAEGGAGVGVRCVLGEVAG